MGKMCPPFYGKKDLMAKLEAISKIDEKINALLIEREELVKDFKESIKEENSAESED